MLLKHLASGTPTCLLKASGLWYNKLFLNTLSLWSNNFFSVFACLSGLGRKNLEKIPVDKYCRMDIDQLRVRLEHCLQYRIPVLGVTAVFGTTQVSSCRSDWNTACSTGSWSLALQLSLVQHRSVAAGQTGALSTVQDPGPWRYSCLWYNTGQ